jgi:tetratricopeptide (TPR) repeat protein
MSILSPWCVAAGALLVLSAAGHPAFAQAPAGAAGQAAGHVHYSKPEQAAPSPTGQLAPRLQNLGTHAFPVTTKSASAQRFMNQGLNLSYGFNHLEAGRAYAEAARLDPLLAMAFWGQALVLGPNINSLMDPADEPKAYELVRKAVSLRGRASPREAALIDALAQRYSGKAEDRAARDAAYAAAMAVVVKRFPNDLDAATLSAEAVMDLRPWGYWMPDGRPHEGTKEAVLLIESVIKRNPKHPGALHLYIHLMESVAPEKAEVAADRLLTLMPAAGHMVHMPSHIYQRVGRYADAVKSNQLAVTADEDYITQCRAQGLYPMGYYPHNLHFLWFAATFAGRGELAIESARQTASKASDEALKQLPLLAGFRVVPWLALTRFGRWDEMLKEPAPPGDNLYLAGVWSYARGLAFIAKGQLGEADRALADVKRIAADKALDFDLFSPNSAAAIFAIAPEALAGELAAARRDYDAAIAHLERAVRLEDGLVYTEPSEWHYPPRHALGAVLLEAGRPAEAETVYWQDLKQNPDNGWALTGLRQALEAQGRKDDVALVAARLKKAWADADVKTTSSRIMR